MVAADPDQKAGQAERRHVGGLQLRSGLRSQTKGGGVMNSSAPQKESSAAVTPRPKLYNRDATLLFRPPFASIQ